MWYKVYGMTAHYLGPNQRASKTIRAPAYQLLRMCLTQLLNFNKVFFQSSLQNVCYSNSYTENYNQMLFSK